MRCRLDEFARAYLNRRTQAGASVIDIAAWQAVRDTSSQLKGLPCFSLDVTPDRAWSSIGVAGWRADRRVHVEVVDHRPGTDWVVERLHELDRQWSPWPVVVDPAGPAGSLLVDLAALGVRTETLAARDYAAACGQFYDAVTSVHPTLAHLDQPVLNIAAASARKRVLGDAWAWARKVGGDISPLVAVTLARYGLVKAGDQPADPVSDETIELGDENDETRALVAEPITIPLVVQLVGLVLLCVGIGLASVPAAIASAGFGLILFGLSAELGAQQRDRERD